MSLARLLPQLREELQSGDPTQTLAELEHVLLAGPTDLAELTEWTRALWREARGLSRELVPQVEAARDAVGDLTAAEVHPAHQASLDALKDPAAWFGRLDRRLRRLDLQPERSLDQDLERTLLSALAGDGLMAVDLANRALEKASETAPSRVARASLVRAKVLELSDDPGATDAYRDLTRQWRSLSSETVARAAVGVARMLQSDPERVAEREEALELAARLGMEDGIEDVLIEAALLQADLRLQQQRPTDAVEALVRAGARLRVMGRSDALIEGAVQRFAEYDASFAMALDG